MFGTCNENSINSDQGRDSLVGGVLLSGLSSFATTTPIINQTLDICMGCINSGFMINKWTGDTSFRVNIAYQMELY